MTTDLTIPESTHQFLDTTNPQHFINLVPQKIKDLILQIPNDYFALSEKKLINKAYKDGVPEDVDMELRISFWQEYENKFEKSEPMNINSVCRGVCSSPHFYQNIATNPYRLLFIITEVPKVQTKIKLGYHLSLQKMLDLLKASPKINTKTGLPDAKVMDLQLKVFQYLDQRLHGSLIQRVETKAVNVNVEAQAENKVNLNSVEDIDKAISQLEIELSKPSLPNEPRLLTPMDTLHMDAGRVSEEYKK